MTEIGAGTLRNLQELVRRWSERIDPSRVEVLENREPENEEFADYEICYEVVFQPIEPRCAWLELALATDGRVGVCLENISRIKRHLSKKYNNIQNEKSVECAFGFELLDMNINDIDKLIDIIAYARFTTSVIYINKLFNVRRALISEEECNKLETRSPLRYIFTSRDVISWLSNRIEYLPWITREGLSQ